MSVCVWKGVAWVYVVCVCVCVCGNSCVLTLFMYQVLMCTGMSECVCVCVCVWKGRDTSFEVNQNLSNVVFSFSILMQLKCMRNSRTSSPLSPCMCPYSNGMRYSTMCVHVCAYMIVYMFVCVEVGIERVSFTVCVTSLIIIL